MPDQWQWTSPQGAVVNLTDWAAGYYVQPIGEGAMSPTYELVTDQYAGVDGSTVQAVRADPRTLTLGLYIDAPSKHEFRTKARALVRALRPKGGAGLLTVTTEWGDTRSLECYCTGGLEGDMALDVGGSGFSWRMVLKFYAPDPWWFGAEQGIDFGLGAPTTFFPIFPLLLSASTVQGEFTVDLSDTDSPTYPIWTVTGPGSGLVLTNVTSGRVIQVNALLGTGELMVIDTRPGKQSIRRGDGTSLMSTLASDPALWPLVEGVNVVTAALVDATADSRIAGAYSPRYASI